MRVFQRDGKYYAAISDNFVIDPLYRNVTDQFDLSFIKQMSRDETLPESETWQDYSHTHLEDFPLHDPSSDYAWIDIYGHICMATEDMKRSAAMICCHLFGTRLGYDPNSAYAALKKLNKMIYVSIDMKPEELPSPRTLEQKEGLELWKSLHNM